jgi:hypothetical protein
MSETVHLPDQSGEQALRNSLNDHPEVPEEAVNSVMGRIEHRLAANMPADSPQYATAMEQIRKQVAQDVTDGTFAGRLKQGEEFASKIEQTHPEVAKHLRENYGVDTEAVRVVISVEDDTQR